MIKKIIKKLVPSKVKLIVKLAIHSGDKYICPFCGYSAKDMFPIGFHYKVLNEKQVIGGGRRNGGCYKCGSSDRERLVYIYLKNVENVFNKKNLRVLHLAPEKKLSNIFIQNGFEKYICGDLFTEGYKYPDYVQKMNVLNIPYEDNFFDLVICNHLLEHVPTDIDAMKELYRVLKPNGKAILQVPISKNSVKTFEDFSVKKPTDREELFGQFDHVRIYGQDYVERLSSAEFKIERVNISKKYEKYGLCIDEDLFIGIK
jgi:SAM-dependent methyltransferase